MKTKIVYILSSRDDDCFYEMFMLSLKSLKASNPGAHIEVVIDEQTRSRLEAKQDPLLKDVILIVAAVPPEMDIFGRSRFIKTKLRQLVKGDFLYLDTDTIVCSPLDEIDSVDADIAAVADRNGPLYFMPKETKALCRKAGFHFLEKAPYYNGGVFFVRDTETADRFFRLWHKRWKESLSNGVGKDQPAMLQANIDSGLLIKELPGQWNCQVCSWIGARFFNTAKIIHYYASYSDFLREFIVPHIKDNCTLDSRACAIAADPLIGGPELYHHSYKNQVGTLPKKLAYRAATHPVLYGMIFNLNASLGRLAQWVLNLRHVRKPSDTRKAAAAIRMEKLDRGLAAIKTEGGVFLSWRMLLGEDPVYGTAQSPTVYTIWRDSHKITSVEGCSNYRSLRILRRFISNSAEDLRHPYGPRASSRQK